MSLVVRKPVFGVSDQVQQNWAVQSQKMARGSKFCISELEGLCTIYLAKTKALISFPVTAKLFCVFFFAYAQRRFSHDDAHMKTLPEWTDLTLPVDLCLYMGFLMEWRIVCSRASPGEL